MEDSEKRELGKIRSGLATEENKKEEVIKKAAQSGAAMDQKKLSGNFTILDFLLHGNFLQGSQNRMRRQNRKIKEIEKRVTEQREKVVEAMKKRQIFSTLKRHRYQEYLVEETRAEQKFLDEIVATRWKPGES